MTTDPQDFVGFVAGRGTQLFRSAYLLTGDYHQAEDLLQTTLVKLYASWKRVQSAENPVAYAHTTLFRTFVSQKRLRSSHEKPTSQLPEQAAEAGADPALRLVLLDALTSLSPSDRAIVVLRYWEDRSVEETAATLGLRSSVVKTRCRRALQRLRSLLGNEIHEYAGS
ncbi:SigE family RNA polymerase sigma factor [Flindersiella endophytica]